MDAPLQSSDSHAELALLRRRAYGPDADIDDDPRAVARLAELESGAVSRAPVTANRTAAEAQPPTGQVAAEAQPPGDRVAAEAGASRPLADSAEPGVAAHELIGDGASPKARRSTRRLVLPAVALAAAIIGAAATAGILALTAPGPDVTLEQADVDPLEDAAFAGSWIGSFRVDRQGLQGFEEYRGFRPWVGIAADGLVCLFITIDSRDLVGVSCMPPSVPPVADVQAGNGTISLGGGPRMVVRFELRDDRIWVHDRQVTSDEAAP